MVVALRDLDHAQLELDRCLLLVLGSLDIALKPIELLCEHV